MENYEYKYILKLPQFVKTLNSRKNCSIGLKPKLFQNSGFFVHSLLQTSMRIQETKI